MEELQISQRGIDMPASPIRKLAPLAYAAEDRGVKIYRLSLIFLLHKRRWMFLDR